jgi:hypothetical protein
MDKGAMGLEYKRRYTIQCARRISGITFIIYMQSLKIGKPNHLKIFGAYIYEKKHFMNELTL